MSISNEVIARRATRHTRYLPCNGAADFRLSVFQELHKRRDQISVNHLLIDRFRNLDALA